LEEDDEHRLEHIIPLQNTTPSNAHDQTPGYKTVSETTICQLGQTEAYNL
jgi:hypothetical protein